MTYPTYSRLIAALHPRAVVLAVLLLYAGGGMAQTAPNAGQLLRDLQVPSDLAPSRPGPALKNEEIAQPKSSGSDVKFFVKRLHFSGNALISGDALHALLADLEGAEHSLAELNAATARITAYYRDQGFPVTRAYLPAQEIKDGEITIVVVEGRIGEQKINNRARLSDTQAAAYLDTAKQGEIIRGGQIDRGLLILNDTPGVGSARATLQPGASVGTSDLLVELTPGAAYTGSIDLDNFGNRYVGEYRIGGTLNINSPLQIGDVLMLNVLSSGRGLNYGRVVYQLPIGGDGFRVGAAYADTNYKLGEEFSSLDAHGVATSTSLFAAYPFIRSQKINLNGTLSLEQKGLSDTVGATFTTTNKRVNLASFGLQGTFQDGFGGGGFTSASLTATVGKLDIRSPSALAIDAASAQTNGYYQKLSYSLTRLQRLTSSNFLYATVSGQQAGKNLDSSEKFSLGGAVGVRAYPQGEANGDEGLLASIELRHNINDALQLTLFYDTGTIRVNETPFGVTTANKRTLSGAGIGVNANVADFRIRASMAWRTGSEKPVSVPASAVQTPTLWVQLSRGF